MSVCGLWSFWGTGCYCTILCYQFRGAVSYTHLDVYTRQTSLDVTMYGHYTSASDSFTVSRTHASVKSIVNAFTSTNMKEDEYPAIINADGASYDLSLIHI